MRQTNTQITPLFGLVLMATFTASAFAQPAPVERKFSEDVKYYNPYMAVILETSIYDMFEGGDPKDLDVEIMQHMIKDPVAEVISGLGYLRASTLPQDKAMAKKWGMKDTTSASWLEWLGERVKVVTAADYTNEEFWTTRFEIDKRYPISRESFQAATNTQQVGGSFLPTARNVTSELLFRSLTAGYALRYKGANFPVLVGGSHFGIVKLYPDFFQSRNLRVKDKSSKRFSEFSYISKIQRNSILIHEARHSDGGFTNPGFSHVNCPAGHPYHNPDKTKKEQNSCDRSQNGPYSIEADSLKLYLAACKGGGYNLVCTAEEIDVLSGLVANSEANVLVADIYALDGDGNKVVEFLDPAPFIIQGIPQKKMPRE